MTSGVPRHLADPPPRRQRRRWSGVGLAVLLVVAAAAAWVRLSAGPEPAADRGPADPSAVASPPDDHATGTSEAEAPTATKASADEPKNLLANASFEGGWQGWQPAGGARVTRSTDSTSGDWSLRVLANRSGNAPVGITVPGAALTRLNGRYHTNAWVRPSAPGTTVTISLREYRDGRPVPGSNTLGWTVEREGWRQFGAIHVATQDGSQLALEIMARDLPPDGYLDIDEVVLHLLPNRS
jgi:hypothetical protein